MTNSENLLTTLDQFNAAVFLKNPQGRYLSMNHTGIQLVQKNSSAVLGKSAFDLFDLKSASEMIESDEYVLNSNRVYARSFDAMDRETGKPLHIFTAKTPVISPSGRALGTVGISIVNYKNFELFAESCKLLPQFIQFKSSALIGELIETRTIADFFKIH